MSGFTLKYPEDWQTKNTPVGNYYFASSNYEANEDGLGDGYDLSKGALVCVPYLPVSNQGEDY